MSERCPEKFAGGLQAREIFQEAPLADYIRPLDASTTLLARTGINGDIRNRLPVCTDPHGFPLGIRKDYARVRPTIRSGFRCSWGYRWRIGIMTSTRNTGRISSLRPCSFLCSFPCLFLSLLSLFLSLCPSSLFVHVDKVITGSSDLLTTTLFV